MKQSASKTLSLILWAFFLAAVHATGAWAQNTAAVSRTASTTTSESGKTTKMRILALRLRPGQDLRQQLEAFVKEKKIRAGFIITGVGSLRSASIRLADQPSAVAFSDKFEIVSLVGTLGQDGVHLHISISDKTGKTIGGHLVEGCLIYTTAEIVIGDASGLVFTREQDKETGYKELRICRVRSKLHKH
jgi:predicted DNA-binding protein with PD1-like motif